MTTKWMVINQMSTAVIYEYDTYEDALKFFESEIAGGDLYHLYLVAVLRECNDQEETP